MSYEVARFECDVCDARFLTALALRGHQSTHAEETASEAILGP